MIALWLALAFAADPSEIDALVAREAPASAPPPAAEVEDRTKEIADRLRCPVCQGMPVSESTSHPAVSMKGLIREMVARGYTEEQITAYFVESYGEWVLLEPPAEGLNWLLWLAPIGVLGAALAAAAMSTSRRPAEARPAASSVPPVDDPYAKRLLAELEDDVG